MSKNIEDVCIVVQARLNSSRIPGKMLRPFAGSTLVDILLEKLKKSSIIPHNHIYLAVGDEELKEVGIKYGINIFERSRASLESEGHQISEIFEWHSTLPYKYIIMVSACNPLLRIETIDLFVKTFLDQPEENSFGVFEKKTYFWNTDKITTTDWKNYNFMNTKLVDPVYEAAHCLYASRMDIIGDDYWMSKEYPPQYHLFVMDELESFDIDYEWQFTVGEKLYEEFMRGTKNEK